jgi:hypothetical protein
MIIAQNLARLMSPHPGGPPRNRTGVNYSTGRLAVGIITTKGHSAGGDLEGNLVALPKHALWVHEGTRPHDIRPTTPGGRLNFFWIRKMRWVSLPHVRHPGQQAQPFLREAVEKVIT